MNKLTEEDKDLLSQLGEKFSEDIIELNVLMHKAVECENYERAAYQRNEITKLINQTASLYSVVSGLDEERLLKHFNDQNNFVQEEIQKAKNL